MVFGEGNLEFKLGKRTGYIIAYAVFTSAFYFVLTLTKRTLSLHYVAAITAFVVMLGLIIKRLLK
jgi:hypothetical protein